MQEYLHKTRLSGVMDSIGLRLLTFGLSMGWFIFLWGLRASSLTAGLALDLMVLSLLRKTQDGRLKRREKRLRCRIGGEMALERLLLQPPLRANFETAMLLSLRYPLSLQRSGKEGMLCVLGEEKLLIAFCQVPVKSSIGAEHVLSFQRAVLQSRAKRGVLCVPCAIGDSARDQARCQPAVSFLTREQLISLFGTANPATDAQLVHLGRRKRASAPRAWKRLVLDHRRGKRYAFYGALLLAMYLFTRLFYYALPGLVCVCLAAACHCRQENGDWL